MAGADDKSGLTQPRATGTRKADRTTLPSGPPAVFGGVGRADQAALRTLSIARLKRPEIGANTSLASLSMASLFFEL